MLVQHISNTQNFQGSINILKNNMSAELQKTLSNSTKKIDLTGKAYSLNIKNEPNGDFVSIVASNNSKKNEKKYTVLVHRLSQKTEILKEAVQDAMNNYERLYPPTFNDKCKIAFNKLGKKIFDVLTDE